MPRDTIPGCELRRKEAGGKRLKARGFTLVYRKGKESSSRLAVVIKKGFGLSTERNKAKRRLRALFCETRGCFKERFDIIVIVHPAFKELSFKQIAQEWLKTLEKGGIIEENSGFFN